MKVLAGLFLFFGLGGLLASGLSHWSSRPYGDGLIASATVVDYVDTDDNKAGIHSIVAFIDQRGQARRGYVDNAAQLARGLTLEVSYRASELDSNTGDPNEVLQVRAPNLNEFGVATTALSGAVAVTGLAGLVYFHRRRLDDLGSPVTLTRDAVMTEPQALLLHLRDRVEPLLGDEIQAGFPVIERRPVTFVLIPLAAVCGALAVVSMVASSPQIKALAVPCMGIAVMLVVIYSRRSSRFGAVAVTATEYVLVDDPVDSANVEVLSRLSRSTPLPRSGQHRGTINGGPILFASNNQSAKQWHFTGTLTTAASIDYRTVNQVLRAPQDQRYANAGAYVASVGDLRDLVNQPISVALPLRNSGALRDLARAFVALKRPSSLLVSPSTYFVVDHATPVRKGELVAEIPRHAADLEEALAKHGRRVDGGLRWVQDLADTIYLQDLQSAVQPSIS